MSCKKVSVQGFYVRRKGMICDCPTDICMKNLWQKAEWGKKSEHLGNHPEAVIGQAPINLDSQVWKSLGDSLPKLYCIDLVEAYVTQESDNSWILCEKKRYDSRLPNGCLHKKPSAKGGYGKENW